MEEIKVEAPEGYELDEVKSSLDNQKVTVTFKKKEPKLPMSWEELGDIDGWYTETFSEVMDTDKQIPDHKNRNIWRTKELAEASLALCQLERLCHAWTEGDNPLPDSWYPVYIDGKITIFLFKDYELRKKFQQTFKHLIKTAKPLL